MTKRTLAEVNAAMPRTSIKGRPYIEVDARVMGFRELYPEGRIVTCKIADDGTRCDFRAEVYDGEVLLATAHAYEVRTAGGPVNSTSYVENCETSAVGRALGFLGIGIESGIASADEVRNAIAQQEAGNKNTAPKTRKKPQKAAEGDTAPEVVIVEDEAEIKAAKQALFNAMKKYCEDSGRDINEVVKNTFAEKDSEDWTVADFQKQTRKFEEAL